MGELVLGTIHRCRGPEVLAARRSFHFPPDLNALARVAFFNTYGATVWVLYCFFEHCRGEHSAELSIFGVSEGPAIIVPASRWKE